MPKRFKFQIDFSGESAAGLSPFSETITVEVESGDLGGEMEEKEFASALHEFFSQWYDGATVKRDEAEDG